MKVTIGDVDAWPQEADKVLALKPLEEAAEVFGAWQDWTRPLDPADRDAARLRIVAEIADVVQACANLAASLDVCDLRFAMDMCERRNRARGRYETPEEYAEGFKECCDRVGEAWPNAMRILEER